jgi:hypothetical protein
MNTPEDAIDAVEWGGRPVAFTRGGVGQWDFPQPEVTGVPYPLPPVPEQCEGWFEKPGRRLPLLRELVITRRPGPWRPAGERFRVRLVACRRSPGRGWRYQFVSVGRPLVSEDGPGVFA